MSSYYTAINAETSANIYFLNDKNIVHDITDTAVSNAIPSYSTFKEKYEELSTYDSNLCSYASNLSTDVKSLSDSLSNSVDQICANISTDLSNEINDRIDAVSTLSNSLSTTVNKEFVHLSGDSITGDLSVSGIFVTPNANIGSAKITNDNILIDSDKKVLIGKAASDYTNTFVWNASQAEYKAKANDENGGTFNINPLHGSNGFYIGEKTLSNIISEDTQLTAADLRSEIKDVSVLLTSDYALFADVSAVSKLTNDAGYLSSNDFDFKYDAENKSLLLYAGKNTISVDATNFIVDGLLYDVSISSGIKPGNSELTTWYLNLTFNVYTEGIASTITKSVDLENLIDVYTASDNGIKLNNNEFSLDFNVVAKTENLDQLSGNIRTISADHETRITTNENDLTSVKRNITTLQTNTATIQSYVNILSGDPGAETTNGIIPLIKQDIRILSTEHSQDIETLYKNIRNNATFAGYLNISHDDIKSDQYNTIAKIFKNNNITNFRLLKNGDIYQVNMEIGFDNNPFDLATRYFDTKDNPSVRLAHKDLIVIFKDVSTEDEPEITEENVHKHIRILPSVRLYEYYDLSVTISSDYFWLSGGNNIATQHAISGDNYFIGRNDIENLSVKTLSANWEEVKHPNGYSLFNLSTDLSNKIYIKDDKNEFVGTSDLSIIKIEKDDYDNLVATKRDTLCSNTLYIIDSDYIDAYEQAISNVVMSSDTKYTNAKTASEATNKNYVDAICADISNIVVISVENLQNQIISNDKDISFLSTQHDWLSISLSNSVDQICANISTDLSHEIDRLTTLNKTLISLNNTLTANYINKSTILQHLNRISETSQLTDVVSVLIDIKNVLN